mmetsp:Transcript_65469/g.76923  ORF Transcript_65469/g.76923 Transcript_65469/m.76923 type:complete len:476 (-) Transcript_65469:77-1504(-)
MAISIESNSLLANFLPDWPVWAMNLLIGMSVLTVIVLILVQFLSSGSDSAEKSNGSEAENQKKVREFKAFRNNYIMVYLVIMLADWMQGTHMYTLYLSYGVNISALFLTGFFSGAVFAPFLGSAVDKFGRKKSCIVYCVLEIIINTLEHSTDFRTLLFGRVLGGISTNLLFSAFESWMTSEHRKKGFPESWLSQTYAATSIGNGAMAILAGIVAQLLEDQLGHIGPFQGAIALTVLALVMVAVSWEENYGEDKSENNGATNSLYKQFITGWKTTISDSNILRIGLIQSLSEGAMYTFVFMWVPTLLSLDPPEGLPTGAVFSALMMAITMGGALFPPLQNMVSKFTRDGKEAETSAFIVYTLAAVSMAVPSLCFGSAGASCFETVLICFVLCEFCVGLFMPVAGTLRSKYIPDSLQGAILNIFRLPLNSIVVFGTYATDVLETHNIFMLVSVWFLCAALLQGTMIFSESSTKKKVA